MKLNSQILITVLLVVAACYTDAAEPNSRESSASWLGFRGDTTSATSSPAPDKLDIGEDGNLAWQLAMPGRSVAGPIVAGDVVVTTGSSGQYGEVLHISGVEFSTGQLLWEHEFRATGRPFCHPTSANAAPTPVSDGKYVYAFFSSNDLVCLTLSGDLVWYRGLGFDYPKAGNDTGMAASPLLVDGVLIVQIENQGDSLAAGIDATTGKHLWRIDRPRRANWTSPVAIKRPDDRIDVILQSGSGAVAIDPKTGVERWNTEESGASVPSATVTDKLLLLPGNELIALDYGSSAATPEVVWRNSRLSPQNASVVTTEERVYALKGSVLVAGNLDDGEVIWKERLSEVKGTWATPVVTDNRLYIFDQTGVGLIVEDRGDDANVISEVALQEPVLASPAIVSGRLIVRGDRNLYCFE